MGRRALIGALAALAITGGSAVAASRWIITSTSQIKPSVVSQLRARFATLPSLGKVGDMCPGGSGSCDIAASDARCPGRSIVTGGGFDGGNNPPIGAFMAYDEPDRDGRGWHIIMGNDSTAEATFQTFAVCAGTVFGKARDARAAVPASVRRQISRELATTQAAAR
jgi:hypothetical protein